MKLSPQDREVLRDLATQYAELASLPVHKEKAEMWRKCNDLETGVRPMVYANEVCWNEMNVNDELTCVCTNEQARGLERWMRQELALEDIAAVLAPELVMPVAEVLHWAVLGCQQVKWWGAITKEQTDE